MRLIRLLPLLCLLVLVGCAGGIRDTGFLDDYARFNKVEEKNLRFRLVSEEEDRSLEPYFLTPREIRRLERKDLPVPSLEADGISPADIQPVLFVVSPPQWATAKTLSNEREQNDLTFVIRERIYRYLLREYPHPVQVRFAWVPGDPMFQGHRVIEVQTAVTDLRHGSGWTRYLIGYGAGSAVIQIEGRLVDMTGLLEAEEGQVVAEFAARVAHGAYPNGYVNPSVIRDEYALKYGAEAAIRKLAPVVRAALPPAQPLLDDMARDATASR